MTMSLYKTNTCCFLIFYKSPTYIQFLGPMPILISGSKKILISMHQQLYAHFFAETPKICNLGGMFYSIQ